MWNCEKIERIERCGWPTPILPTPHILLVIVILLSRFLVEVLPEQSLYIIISCWSHIRDIAFKVHLINVNPKAQKYLLNACNNSSLASFLIWASRSFLAFCSCSWILRSAAISWISSGVHVDNSRSNSYCFSFSILSYSFFIINILYQIF